MGRFTKVFLVIVIFLLIVSSFGQAELTEGDDNNDLPPGVSGDWWTTAQKNIRDGEYNLSQASGEKKALYQAPKRAQGFRSFFSEKGVRLIPREEETPSWE